MRVTIKDIARVSGYDASAVSRVLRDDPKAQLLRQETRERIRAAAAQLGYHPNLVARCLKTGRSHMIGLVGFSIQNDINASAVVAITSRLLEHGYRTQLLYDRGEEQLCAQACQNLMYQGCDAIIVSSHCGWHFDFVNSLSVPVFVVATNSQTHLPDRTICWDYESGCRAALSELVALGHRHIMLVAQNWEFLNLDPRYYVLQDYYLRNFPGRDFRDCICTAPADWKDFTPEFLKSVLAEHSEVTAFLSANDAQALVICRCLEQLGLSVPEDISLIGFDDIFLSQFFGLSTVRKDIDQSAENVVKMVLNVLEGTAFEVEKSVPCPFIQRSSMARAREGRIVFDVCKKGMI